MVFKEGEKGVIPDFISGITPENYRSETSIDIGRQKWSACDVELRISWKISGSHGKGY